MRRLLGVGLVSTLLLLGCTSPKAISPREGVQYIPVAASEKTKAAWLNAVVLLTEGRGSGSGFFLNGAGSKRFVVTARHVSKHLTPAEAKIIATDGDEYKMVGAVNSEKTDAAIIFLDREADEPGLDVSCRDAVFQETVYIPGHPYGIAEEVLTTGKVAGVKKITHPQIPGIVGVLLDIRSSPGNSGSPVLDKHGKVIGILVAGIPGGGVAIMVPINDVCQELGFGDRA
jgi:S1-C subfamily serine protease